MRFEPIASSSEGCAYLLHSGGHSILLDCGVPIKWIQRATGFKVSQLAGCLVTHGHGDHCKSVKELAKAGVDVYASADTWKAIGPIGHRAKTLVHDEQVSVGDFWVKGFDVPHDCQGTMGFVVQGSGGTLVYLTDAAYSKFTFPGATILALECNFDPQIVRDNVESGRIPREVGIRTIKTHMSLPRLIELLRLNMEKGHLPDLREVHLLHLSDANSNEEEFKDAVARVVGCPVYVAQKRPQTGVPGQAPPEDIDRLPSQGRIYP